MLGVLAGAPWVTSAANGKVGWALQQDYAEATAAVLSGNGHNGHENTIYELSGKNLTQEEFVSILGNVVGKEVILQQVDDTTYAGFREGTLEVESTILRNYWDVLLHQLMRVLLKLLKEFNHKF